AAAAAAIPKLSELETQNAANVLWCSAGVKFTGTQVIEATSEAALQRSATFLSQDISNTAQALTTLLSVSRALPQALAHRVGDLQLKPQEPANTAQ
ncbi:unnamed protein product, partial [Symbiodinium microadriaticum]